MFRFNLLTLTAFSTIVPVFFCAVTDKFTESMYVLANEPSVALYRLQEHVRRSLPELVQHKVNALLLSAQQSCRATIHRHLRSAKIMSIIRTCTRQVNNEPDVKLDRKYCLLTKNVTYDKGNRDWTPLKTLLLSLKLNILFVVVLLRFKIRMHVMFQVVLDLTSSDFVFCFLNWKRIQKELCFIP